MKKTTKMSKTVKTSKKSVSKSVAKKSSGRSVGRPKGSKNKPKTASTSSNRPVQVAPTGTTTVVDSNVVVSHPAEVPSSIVERTTAAIRRN